MCEIFCVTNRKLCKGDFFEQLEKIACSGVSGIILREKDLTESEYEVFAEKALEICKKHGCKCILHSFAHIAIRLGAENIHLPLHLLEKLTEEQKRHFSVIGASCHSAEEAAEAQRLGCTYITAGHVFATDCKKGLAPRGLDFLQNVCKSVSVPVYGIGGISAENAAAVIEAGAAGICIMSGLMQCESPHSYLEGFKEVNR